MAAAKVVEMIKTKQLENRTEYITFSKDAMRELISHTDKGTPVYYLKGDLTPS